MARRTVSRLNTRGVQPLAWQTWSYQGQSPGAVELALGSRTLMEQVTQGFVEGGIKEGLPPWGREDFCFRQASPSAAKAWTALRTERAEQPRLRAIRSRGLARRTGQQDLAARKVKAVVERSPSWRHCRSVFVRVRTKVMTGLILHYSPLNSLGKGLFRVCTRKADLRQTATLPGLCLTWSEPDSLCRCTLLRCAPV